MSAALEGAAAESFDALALDLGRFQLAHVEAFARLSRARGASLEVAGSADAIAAVPSDVFRLTRVAAHAADADVKVFRTSGTTQGIAARGEHFFRTTSTYAAAALGWGERMLWPEGPGRAAIAVAVPPGEAEDSSLSFMIDLFATAVAGPVTWHIDKRGLDNGGVERACVAATAVGRPALVMGTALAFDALCSVRPGAYALPPGSRVMVTGGFKGSARQVSADELYRSIASAFAIPAACVIGEYGMTELSSQLYEAAWSGPGVYWPPPWLRVRAADPISLDALPFGEVGIARFVDLANVD